MKIAVIPPHSLLREYGTLGDGYHLCLSNEVLENQRYANFYADRANAGDHVILDNSAHEQLEGQSLDQLVRATRMIRPTEVVLPDRLFFGEDTIERSTEAAQRFRQILSDVKLVGVPQGRMPAEWRHCLRQLVELGVDTIGISKDYEVWPGGLEQLVSLVENYAQYDSRSRPMQIHLLGWGREMWQLAPLADRVRGVDSAKPIVFGMNGVELPYDITQENCPKYPRRKTDYFETGPERVFDTDRIVRHNIDVFRYHARGRTGVRQFTGS